MKKSKIKKILMILSIIILFLGIIAGFSISKELENATIPSGKIYVDGSDFTGLTRVGGFIIAKMMGMVIVFYSIVIDVLIWGIYGIVLLMSKIIKKIKDKKSDQ